jgi:DNA-binding NarL/FixJ family response regulator
MNSSKPITVLLAEDHVVVRQGLSALLGADGRFHIVGGARTGREAVDLARTLRPDVVLMDIAMPVLNGMEATRQIMEANPKARVLILSAHSDDEYIQRLCAVGAAGFLEKQSSAEILTQAIQEVAGGKKFFSPSIARRMRAKDHGPVDRDGLLKANAARLTTREAEVLQLVAEGSANKQVAATLGISVNTVEKHRQSLMTKLGLHNTASLTRYAIATGVISGGVQVTII